MLKMAWYQRKKLDNYSTQIVDSIKQLEVYVNGHHVVRTDFFKYICDHIQTLDVASQLRLLENTSHIVQETKTLLELEQKRRITESTLNEMENKNVVKNARVEKRKERTRRRANPYLVYTRSRSSSQAIASSQESTE